MSITQEQIKKISENLTRLPNQWEKIEQDLNSILWYINNLNEINTDWIEPTVSVTTNRSLDSFEAKKVINYKNPNNLLKSSKNKIIANQIAVWNILK